MTDYFAVFGLKPDFTVDLAALEKKYFEAQRTFHPDRMVGKSAKERSEAALRSMQINEAYEALREPLSRARHLLALQGVSVGGDRDAVKPSQELLMEVLELREQLESAGMGEIEKLGTTNAAVVEETLAQLLSAFAKHDWQQATGFTLRLQYLNKLSDEIRIRKKGMAGAA